MDNDTASIIVSVFVSLSTVSFLLLAVGLFKPSFVIRRPSLQTRKGVFLVWGLSAIFLTGGGLLVAGIAEPTAETSPTSTYYVGAKSANVRECPSTSCKIIDSLSQNTPLAFPGDLFDRYPDWAEITFPNGQLGYVSKTTLSEKPVPESRLAPTDDSSSVGGITIGPWNDIQITTGQSYEFHFCEPSSAISGTTCGGLADTTTDPKGGTPPYSFVKKSGFLPPGMALELNGTLRGSPTETGTYNFRLCAKDLYGGEGCQNLAVVVKQASSAISNQPGSEQSMTLGNTLFDVTVSSGGCGPKWAGEGDFMGFVSDDEWDGSFFEGDVSGPVETSLRLTSDGSDKLDCGGWNAPGWGCERVLGQPETTHWKLTSGDWVRTGYVEIRPSISFYCDGAATKKYSICVGRFGDWQEKEVISRFSCS